MAQQIVRPHELRLDTPKAAIYARLSTLNGQNPDVQTREIKGYCQRRRCEIFSVYVDKGVSGKKDSRPQLNRMMEDAHQRRCDVVVVARFVRFARSVSHLLRALETFNALGTQFVSLAEQVDTRTPTGKMIFTVLGAVSELERNLIVERVHSGLRHARAKSKRLGVRLPGEAKLSIGTVFAAAQADPIAQKTNQLAA